MVKHARDCTSGRIALQLCLYTTVIICLEIKFSGRIVRSATKNVLYTHYQLFSRIMRRYQWNIGGYKGGGYKGGGYKGGGYKGVGYKGGGYKSGGYKGGGTKVVGIKVVGIKVVGER